MFSPAFFVDIDGASGAVIDVGSGIFPADGTLHPVPPRFIISPYSSGGREILFYKVTLPLYPPPFDEGGGIIYFRGAKPL
jgi:hypothetical protein